MFGFGKNVAKKGNKYDAKTAAEKTTKKAAEKKALKGLWDSEKKNYQENQKANRDKVVEEDSKYEYVAAPPKFHKGGTVRKSGLAELKKGEVVLTEKQAHKLKRVGGKSSTKKVSTHKKLSKKRVSLKRS
jgi:hypothetical protein